MGTGYSGKTICILITFVLVLVILLVPVPNTAFILFPGLFLLPAAVRLLALPLRRAESVHPHSFSSRSPPAR